ncbi:MAG: 3'-5' exonuclease [Prolixibacteraceae bacterium]
MFQEYITREELDELPLRAFEGEIVVVDQNEKLESAVNFLSSQKMLGFDTETKPSFKRGQVNQVALLQLSTGKRAFLFRINKIGLPEPLKKILSNPEILKVGVAIHDDIKGLQRVSPFRPAGFIELQQQVKDYGINDFSLKKIAGIVLGVRISKSQRLSNWEADELTEAQECYAATDAWISFQILHSLAAGSL